MVVMKMILCLTKTKEKLKILKYQYQYAIEHFFRSIKNMQVTLELRYQVVPGEGILLHVITSCLELVAKKVRRVNQVLLHSYMDIVIKKQRNHCTGN